MPAGHRYTNKVRKARKVAFAQLVDSISANSDALHLLLDSWMPPARQEFEKLLTGLVSKLGLAALADEKPDMLFGHFIQHNHDYNTQLMEWPIAEYKQRKHDARWVHRFAVAQLGLQPGRGDDLCAQLETVYVTKREHPYPPKDAWICESGTIRKLWEHQLTEGERFENRTERRDNIVDVKPSELQAVIPKEKSCKIVERGADGKETLVAIVLRNAVTPDNGSDLLGFLEHGTQVLRDGVIGRESIRKDDPGALVQAGYSNGARKRPMFNWVRNIRNAGALGAKFIADSEYQTSCLFAVAWNIACARLPSEIIDPWVDFNNSLDLPRMDANSHTRDTTGNIHFKLKGEDIIFHNVDLAPSCGMIGKNYSRYVHDEKQPHPWAVQWTLHRNAPVEAGGHFYLAGYAVKIEQEADTFIAWKPSDPHATSLAEWAPKDKNPEFEQLGLALVTPANLRTTWNKHSRAYRMQLQPDAVFGKAEVAEDLVAKEAREQFLAKITQEIEDSISRNVHGSEN